MSNKKVLLCLFFILVAFIFLYRLDYPYFFTDEILYIDSGREHLQGVYTSTMQVPLLTKYLAATMYHLADHRVFLLRLPFALMGILTTLILYKILKREYGTLWGIVGVLLFTSSNIIYSATRMVMLEPLMHLTWLSYLYLYYKVLEKNQSKLFLFSGFFLGLALASKITSIVLIPFSVIFIPYLIKRHQISIKAVLPKYLAMYLVGTIVFISTYIHSFYTSGERYTVRVVFNALLDVYFVKSVEGKIHIINNKLYLKSPYWAYAYFIYIKGGVLRTAIYIIGLISSLFNKSIFVVYWFVFFSLSLVFHQLSGVKNIRYVSSFEIPLVILVVSGFYYLSSKWQHAKTVFVFLVSVFFISHLIYVAMQPRTEYNALFENYLKNETDNFTSDAKIYIYGSTRSSRWYKHGKAEGKNMFEISNDLDAHCSSFYQYDYLIIEKEDLQKSNDNLLYKHAIANLEHYEMSDKYGFFLFEKAGDGEMLNVCYK